LCSVLCGAATRIILEFTLPKDGYLIYPFDSPEFYKYGTAVSANYPPFFDKTEDMIWNAQVEQCKQSQYEDYTGVDSLSAFGVSILVYIIIQWIEQRHVKDGVILFSFPGMQPYDKIGEINARLQTQLKEEKQLDTIHDSASSNLDNNSSSNTEKELDKDSSSNMEKEDVKEVSLEKNLSLISV
jgi:hypothetical protein